MNLCFRIVLHDSRNPTVSFVRLTWKIQVDDVKADWSPTKDGLGEAT